MFPNLIFDTKSHWKHLRRAWAEFKQQRSNNLSRSNKRHDTLDYQDRHRGHNS